MSMTIGRGLFLPARTAGLRATDRRFALRDTELLRIGLRATAALREAEVLAMFPPLA